jgi:hypothetical protein
LDHVVSKIRTLKWNPEICLYVPGWVHILMLRAGPT